MLTSGTWVPVPVIILRLVPPMCRAERAYADTTVLKGMDDFLISIDPILNQQENRVEKLKAEDDDN